MGKGSLVEVEQGTPKNKFFIELMLQVESGKPSGLLPKNCIVLHRNIDGHVGCLQAWVQDLNRPGLIVYCVVNALLELPPTCRHAYRTLGNVEGPYRDSSPALRFVAPFEPEPVFFGILQGSCLCLGVEVPENVLLLVWVIALVIGNIIHPASQHIEEVFPERLHFGKDDQPILRIDGNSRYVVEKSIPSGLYVIVDIEAVKVEYIQKDAFLQGFGDGRPAIVRIHRGNIIPGRRIIVQDIHLKILLVQLKCPCGVNVFHHQVPDGVPHIGDVAFEQLQNQSIVIDLQIHTWCNCSGIHPTVGEFPYPEYLSVKGILKSDCKYLIIAQTLVQGDIPKLGVKSVIPS